MAFQITTTAFRDGSSIPKKFTCDGPDVSPALSWGDSPAGTKSLAIIADDPDAPAGPGCSAFPASKTCSLLQPSRKTVIPLQPSS